MTAATDLQPAPSPLGVAIIGLGRAGQARQRDLQAAPGLELVDAIGGRAGPDAHRRLITDPRVDAVLVCTENALHGSLAEMALAAGRHVLVEFPLAGSASACQSLLDLARANDVILQQELIGLLTERHRGLVARAEQIATVEVAFAGGRYRWIDDELALGHHGQLAIGRLHALWDLCGPLVLINADRCTDGAVSALTVTMAGAAGQRVRLQERRGPEIARGSVLVARDADGADISPAVVEPLPLGLFATDLDVFVKRIRSRGRVDGYVSAQAIVGVAALADAISAAVVTSDGES